MTIISKICICVILALIILLTATFFIEGLDQNIERGISILALIIAAVGNIYSGIDYKNKIGELLKINDSLVKQNGILAAQNSILDKHNAELAEQNKILIVQIETLEAQLSNLNNTFKDYQTDQSIKSIEEKLQFFKTAYENELSRISQRLPELENKIKELALYIKKGSEEIFASRFIATKNHLDWIYCQGWILNGETLCQMTKDKNYLPILKSRELLVAYYYARKYKIDFLSSKAPDVHARLDLTEKQASIFDAMIPMPAEEAQKYIEEAMLPDWFIKDVNEIITGGSGPYQHETIDLDSPI